MGYKCVVLVCVFLQVIGFINPYIWGGIDYTKPPRQCNSILRGNKAGVPYIRTHVVPKSFEKMNFTIFPIKECRQKDAVGVEAIGCDTDLGPYLALTPDFVIFARAQGPPHKRSAALRIIVFCKRKKAVRTFGQFLIQLGEEKEEGESVWNSYYDEY